MRYPAENCCRWRIRTRLSSGICVRSGGPALIRANVYSCHELSAFSAATVFGSLDGSAHILSCRGANCIFCASVVSLGRISRSRVVDQTALDRLALRDGLFDLFTDLQPRCAWHNTSVRRKPLAGAVHDHPNRHFTVRKHRQATLKEWCSRRRESRHRGASARFRGGHASPQFPAGRSTA